MKDIVEELQEASLYAGRASVGAAIERAIAHIKGLEAALAEIKALSSDPRAVERARDALTRHGTSK